MELNFSKKTRKIVASLLAVAILLGVLPVSGLTGNSSGAESSSSENSTKTIYVNSTKQPILFDSVGNFKEIIPKVKKNIYSTEAENGDKIALFTDIGNGNSVVFYKTTEWTPSAYMWKEDSSENPDKNAAWPGEAMKKYGDSNSSLYYYVYGSAKGFDKVIFNDGNDQKNGDQTDNKDLKAWNVYTKTSAGRPICDSLTKCDVSDNFNVYEYADSKLSGKNISAPQGMGATIEIAGTKYTVCGDGAKSEITCYEDDEITSLTANTVDGYTAKVTNSVVGDNQITYSVTYTNKTYGMQFSVENTVAFIKNPRLVLEGKWTVTFNGKKYENGDTICNQKDSVKNLEAAFKIDSVTFNGKEISGYDAKTTLNGNSFDSSCGSNELEKENKLVATVYYEADNGKKYSAESVFSFKYAEGDVTLSENGDDKTVYFDGNNIYTNSDSVTLTLNDESKIEDLTLELYKGDSTPDSKNKIENAIEFDHEKGTITIGNKDVNLSEIKKATLTITSSTYNLSKTYTISYDTISKDNLKYSNTNENNERYYVNAEKGVTVTFNLVGIDKKLFNDENAEVTCNKENVEVSFDKDSKKWKATIKKSDDYTFTFSNNGFVQTVKIAKQDLYLDDKAPKIKSFKIENGSSDSDKLLSFLTFGIYHNNVIKVTVNAEDEDISSGIKDIVLYDEKNAIEGAACKVEGNKASRIFTLDCGENEFKQYMLTAKVVDNVLYESESYTFEKPEKAEDLYSKELTAKISAADIEIVTNTIKPDVTSITSNAYGDNSVKYTDSENREWYSNNIQFNISADDSEVANRHTGIKSVTATFNGTDVSEKLKGLPVFTAEKVESVNDITFNTEGLNLNEGTNTVEVTVVNNSGMSSTKKYEVYVDTIKPEVSQFKFETVKSDVDKILSFLTFGIYNNEKIQVTVSAYDVNNAENAKSGIDYLEENHAEIELYNGKEKIAADDNSYGYENGVMSRTFTLDCGETEFKQYMLTAKAWDNVHNVSASYTFEKPDKAEDLYSKGLKAKQSDSADTEVVTNTIAPIVTEIKSNAYGESSVKYTDEYGKEWYSNGVEFHIYAKDSSDNKHHTGIKSVTAKFNDEEVTLSGLPTFTDKKFESVSDITFNTKVKSGENKVEVTVMNNSGVSSTKTYVVYGDITPPEVENFSFSRSETEADKLLSFLTFGIYSNDKIKVTVTAKDPAEDEKGNKTVYGIGNYSEKNHAEIQLYSAENQGKITAGEYSYNDDGVLSRTFTLACGKNEFNKYMLTAKAWDNVHNKSESYTFEKPETAEFIKNKTTKTFTAIQAEGVKITEVVTNTIAPIVTSITSKEYSSVKYTKADKKEWYSGNIEFNISAKDSTDDNYHTGIKSVTATFNGTDVSEKLKGLPTFTDKKFESVSDITFNTEGMTLKDGENKVEVTVVNNSGVSSTKEYIVYVDTTAPKITSFTIKNNSQNPIVDETSSQKYSYYFQTDTQVTVNADDNAEDKGNYSGIKTIYFRAYDVVTGEEYKSSKNISTDNATASATFTVKANFKGELYAYAVDNVDNNGKTQHGEKKPDDLIVETQQHHNGNASVTMSRAKASYKDNSGLDLYSGNVNARVVFEDAYAGIKDAEIKVSDYTNTVTNTISVSVDNNGNITSSGNGSVTVTGTKAKNTNDNLITNIVVDYVVTDNSNNIKITTSMTDRAGNKTDNVKDSLSIDKTKPAIGVKYDNNEHTTYGGNDYYKADRTATVTVTERNFDESLVEAAIMRNGGRYTTIGGWTHNNNTADPDKSTHVAKIVYNTDGDFTFDIAVKDKAMNSADKFTQQKFTVDKTAPVIDVSFDNNSAKNGNYYKADRTATIKITEHNFNSGSQYVNIPVTAEGTTAPSVVGWSGSGDDHNATVSFNKDGKYSFTVDYTDLAGNKAVQKKVDSFYIDKTAPEVEITGVADHQAYNGTVAPVVTYRDDNFTDDHDFRFTKIDINGKSDDTSKFDYDTGGNGVTEFIYKYRDFAEVLENDGIYNFTVELSDKAGNSTSKSVTFSVNRFGSTFRTTDELTEKLFESGYTNAEQDIVVEEINVTPLTKHSVTLAKSGGNSTELVENTDYTFTSSNNGNEWCKSVYTVNKKNFSDEAAYTVTIMSVDKAKNTNNNRMANSSLSTEQKNKRECAISFVVDKTSPLVSITGIKDNELYKEASKKVKIVCEDDNLDKSKLVVTLDNKKLAEGEDYTIVDDKDGSIAGMLTAEIVLKAETGGIKENLKVTIGDLAGNTGEKSVDNFILSANIFQRFFANPVLVICTFAGLALVIAAVIFFVAKKRKKAE